MMRCQSHRTSWRNAESRPAPSPRLIACFHSPSQQPWALGGGAAPPLPKWERFQQRLQNSPAESESEAAAHSGGSWLHSGASKITSVTGFSEASPSECFLDSMSETEDLRYPRRWYVEGSDPAGRCGPPVTRRTLTSSSD